MVQFRQTPCCFVPTEVQSLRMRVCVCVCVCVCTRACVRACVRVCLGLLSACFKRKPKGKSTSFSYLTHFPLQVMSSRAGGRKGQQLLFGTLCAFLFFLFFPFLFIFLCLSRSLSLWMNSKQARVGLLPPTESPQKVHLLIVTQAEAANATSC